MSFVSKIRSLPCRRSLSAFGYNIFACGINFHSRFLTNTSTAIVHLKKTSCPFTTLQRTYCSSSENKSLSLAFKNEAEFHDIADYTLQAIQDLADGLDPLVDECDIELSQGVLSIKLGEYGTWVVNKQTPNRQIWWSSPISGPRRYEYDSETKKWLNTRDGKELLSFFSDEITSVTGIEVYF